MIRQTLHKGMFRMVHQNSLIYNTCWEDPACDRPLLGIEPDSRVVMITSAGCNALDYALDKPSEIHAIDMNPRQNALLELKKASINAGSFSDHWQLFGEGVHHRARQFYAEALRENLPVEAQLYWDRKIDHFLGKGIRKSFYWHATSGTVAYMMQQYFKFQRKQHQLARRLFEAESLDEQREIYPELEKKVMNNFIKWVLRRQIVMTMLGVPESQHNLFAGDTTDGGFIQKSLRHVFTQLPLKENYFWQLYFNGRYHTECAPNYLQPNQFHALRRETQKLHTYTDTLTGFLQKKPGQYSHYVLLDHQDWLAANDRPALTEEWEHILDNSRQGTKILLRSAAYEVDFLPDFVTKRVTFDREKAAQWHPRDRVGTYGSVYIGTVN